MAHSIYNPQFVSCSSYTRIGTLKVKTGREICDLRPSEASQIIEFSF
jgi:hypothetical protein